MPAGRYRAGVGTDRPAAPCVNEALLAAHLEQIGAALPDSDATRDALATRIGTGDDAELVRINPVRFAAALVLELMDTRRLASGAVLLTLRPRAI